MNSGNWADAALCCPAGNKRVRVIMDTDIANEIDDHFALCEMLLSPERFDVRGVVAAPFLHERVSSHAEGMEKSYRELLNVFGILNLSARGCVFRGADHVMSAPGVPVDSEGARKMIDEAHDAARAGERLYLIGIAAATDLASALLLAPEIAESTVVLWLGGHLPGPWPDDEFNRMQDCFAADHLFACPVPLVQFPCRNMAEQLNLSASELEMRYRGTKILDYLRERTLKEMRFSGNASRVIWDVAPVAWMLQEKEFVSEVISCAGPSGDRNLRRVCHLKRDPLMESLLQILKQPNPKGRNR